MTSPYLGLDIGLKRTGVALSESGVISRPLCVIEATPPHLHGLYKRILELVREHDIATIVAGMPLTADERPTSQSKRVDDILAQLQRELEAADLHPELVVASELGTTADGSRLYPGIDDNMAAAALILQEYLDAHA